MDLADASETVANISNGGAKRLADEAIPAGSQKRRRIINSESSSSEGEQTERKQEEQSSSPPSEKTLSTAVSKTSRTKRFAVITDSDSE